MSVPRAQSAGPGHQISSYRISDRELPGGSTLGAPKAALLIKATGALEKVYSPEAGADVFRTLVLHHWDETTGIPLTPLPGEFTIHPDHQEHLFELADSVTVHEDIFLLSGIPKGDDQKEVDPPAAYYTVELTNENQHPVQVATYASLRLGGSFEAKTQTKYDARVHGFIAWNEDQPQVFRIAACSVPPKSFEVSLDNAKTSAAEFPGKLQR